MKQHYPIGGSNPLSASLVSLIIVINFLIVGGLIFAGTPLSSPDGGEDTAVEVALDAPTATPQPTSTPLPPTATPTSIPTTIPTSVPTTTPSPTTSPPTDVPAASATPQAVAQADEPGTDDADSAYDPALVAHGQELFALCAACHGPDARGIPNLGKDLVDSEFVAGLSDEELLTFIKTGRPLWDPLNTTGIDMPPKGGNPALTDNDILAIIAYIRSLTG